SFCRLSSCSSGSDLLTFPSICNPHLSRRSQAKAESAIDSRRRRFPALSSCLVILLLLGPWQWGHILTYNFSIFFKISSLSICSGWQSIPESSSFPAAAARQFSTPSALLCAAAKKLREFTLPLHDPLPIWSFCRLSSCSSGSDLLTF